MGQFVRVAAASDIPEGTLKAFEVNYVRFVIAHTVEGFFAVANECTHDSEPISNGRIRDREIMCVRHGARFDLETGAVTAPPAIVPLEVFQIKQEGNDLYVYVD